MTTLTFADTHNLVAFLSKPADCEGFEQIATVKAKTINGEVQLQALVDEKKKLTFYKAFFSPKWKFLIHTILQCLSAKTIAWNEFSSTMASVVICLASNQKFNFSKYIFKSMVKNLENVSAQAEMGEGLANPTNSHHTPTIIQPSISQPQRKQRHRKPKRKDTKVPQPSGPTTNVEDKAVYKEMDDSLVRAATTSSSLEAECQETIGDTYARTRFERVSKLSNDPLFARGNTLQSSEDSLKLKELIELCTNVQNRVIDLENTTGDYKFETKISTTVDAAQVSTTVTITPEEITLAQALQDLKAAKPKDKGQAKMIELKPVKKLSKKDQLKLYEEVAQRLQAEFHEQVRIERKKVEKEAEANIALKETWDDIQAKIEADQRKLFAAKRAEEKRNRPPTRAQQRSIMSTYLKNMAGYKHNQLKNKSINDIQKLFNKAMKRVNAFVDMDIELVEGSSKRARTELEKEEIKKQKVDDVQETAKVDKDKEIAELKSLMKVIPGEEEVAVDVIPLATKPPSIVDYKILKEGKISYFQIIRADGSSKRYSAFI
ncbi:hypothetical protein Tco_0903667 [Tanacetum coccineum]